GHNRASVATHSVRSDFTGLAIAAFIACALTVINAIDNAISMASANTHQAMLTWYANPCNQLFIDHHATGKAMKVAMRTSFRKSFDNMTTMLCALAPTTFLIPISLILCCAAKVASPNKPRHAISMVS